MGGILTYVVSFFAPVKQIDQSPDPSTGLTPRDRELIIDTWSTIIDKEKLKYNAVEFFMQLFAEYPYLKDHFKIFKDKPVESLRRNPKLKFHALGVFYAIGSYVENVDDPDTLIGLIQKQAVSHIDRKVHFKEFEDLKLVFLKFAKELLGSRGTPEVVRAWDKFLSAHNQVFKAKQEEEMGQKQGP